MFPNVIFLSGHLPDVHFVIFYGMNKMNAGLNCIEHVNIIFGDMIAEEIKDENWYNLAFDFVDSSEVLKETPHIQNALIFMLCALTLEYRERNTAVINKNLYVMKSPSMNAVKVGMSYDISARYKQLKVSCPDLIISFSYEGMGKLEYIIHRRLKSCCIGGEWYSEKSGVVDMIIREEIENALC